LKIRECIVGEYWASLAS